MPDQERLTMTIPEFAKASGICKNLAYDLARRDKLPVPVIRLGKRMLLSRKAVVALLEGDGKVSRAETALSPRC